MSPPAHEPARPKLLDRLRHACRVRHYSRRTEDCYHDWCRRFILFHGVRHPETMAEPEVNAFLTHLAVDRHVAASTQNQALAALLFLYGAVLLRPLDQLSGEDSGSFALAADRRHVAARPAVASN